MAFDVLDGFDVKSSNHLDKKKGNWATVEAALAGIPIGNRVLGLTVNVINSLGGIDEYWWRYNTTNEGLILKSTTAAEVPNAEEYVLFEPATTDYIANIGKVHYFVAGVKEYYICKENWNLVDYGSFANDEAILAAFFTKLSNDEQTANNKIKIFDPLVVAGKTYLQDEIYLFNNLQIRFLADKTYVVNYPTVDDFLATENTVFSFVNKEGYANNFPINSRILQNQLVVIAGILYRAKQNFVSGISPVLTDFDKLSLADVGFANITGTPDENAALETYINTKIEEVIGAAPGTLDTLYEIADALNNDPDFYATITTLINTKQTKKDEVLVIGSIILEDIHEDKILICKNHSPITITILNAGASTFGPGKEVQIYRGDAQVTIVFHNSIAVDGVVEVTRVLTLLGESVIYKSGFPTTDSFITLSKFKGEIDLSTYVTELDNNKKQRAGKNLSFQKQGSANIVVLPPFYIDSPVLVIVVLSKNVTPTKLVLDGTTTDLLPTITSNVLAAGWYELEVDFGANASGSVQFIYDYQ